MQEWHSVHTSTAVLRGAWLGTDCFIPASLHKCSSEQDEAQIPEEKRKFIYTQKIKGYIPTLIILLKMKSLHDSLWINGMFIPVLLGRFCLCVWRSLLLCSL